MDFGSKFLFFKQEFSSLVANLVISGMGVKNTKSQFSIHKTTLGHALTWGVKYTLEVRGPPHHRLQVQLKY